MQHWRERFLRHGLFRSTFPYGFGEFYHLAISEILNEGRYIVERRGSLMLLYPQVSSWFCFHLGSATCLHIIFDDYGALECLGFSTDRSARSLQTKIGRCRIPFQPALEQ